MSCSTSRIAAAPLAHDVAQHLVERRGLVAVEPGRRLVEQQHVEGPARHRASSTSRRWPVDSAPACTWRQVGDPAQLEGRHRRRLGVLRRCGPGRDELGQRRRRPARPASRRARRSRRRSDESPSCMRWKVRPRPSRPRPPGRRRVTSTPCSRIVAAHAAVEPAAGVERRRLARRRSGPISPVMRPERRREGEVVDRDEAAEARPQVADLEARPRPPPGAGRGREARSPR